MRLRRPILSVLLSSLALAFLPGCRREGVATPDELKARIAALEKEREDLRGRVGDLIAGDPRLQGLPPNAVRVGVPTPLVRTLVERLVAGFVDSVTLRLTKLRVHKSGKIKKVIPIGEYDLTVMIDEVTGNLKTGKPAIAFGGNQVSVSLPVEIASGRGDATIDFVWDGKNVSGAVCGDMHVTQPVTGTVRPLTYPLAGALEFTATTSQIHVQPKLPPIRMHLEVVPSDESWTVVQQVLAAKRGLCGFVIDRVDILGVVKRLVDKGMNVRVPTERVKAIGLPVTVEPSFEVRGAPVNLTVRVGELAITQYAIWMGAQVTLGPKPDGGRSPAP